MIYTTLLEGEKMALYLNETREVKAVVTADTGRVLAWSTDKEPRHISIAVPGDRAKMTPAQALALAEWLRKQASEVQGARLAPSDRGFPKRPTDRYSVQ